MSVTGRHAMGPRGRFAALTLVAMLLVSAGASPVWATPEEQTTDGLVEATLNDEEDAPLPDDGVEDASEADAAMQDSWTTTPPRRSRGATTLDVGLTQKTGTPDWNWQDDSPDNEIIRTNDLITYTVQLTVNGRHDNTEATIELPQGAILNQVPGFCEPGSTLLPAPGDIPPPQIPLTANSWQSIPAQTLVCQLGTIGDDNAGMDTAFDVTVKVRPEVPNGTTLLAEVSVVSDATAAPVESNMVTAQVAAEPQYDISKNAYAQLPNDGSDANNGPLNSQTRTVSPCSFDNTKRCHLISYPLWISIPAGGKGSSPATEFTFTDDLRPESFFGPGITSHPNWKPEYAPRLTVSTSNPQQVHGALRDGTPRTIDNSVRDSGTWTVTGNPGGIYTITLSGGDYTAWTYPNQTSQGYPLPDQQQAAVVSLGVNVEFPHEALTALGELNGTASLLETTNRYRDFEVTSVSGLPNHPGAEEPRNNNRTATLSVLPGGNGFVFQKHFADMQRTMNARPGMIPGQSGHHSGDGTVARGQVVRSNINIQNNGDPSSATSEMHLVACDYWDPAQFTLAPGDYPRSGNGHNSWPSNGEAVWIAEKVEGVPPTLHRVQYGVLSFTPDPDVAGGIDPTIAGGCADSRIAWHDSIAEAGGVENIGAVRAHMTVPRTLQKLDGGTLAIALRATDAHRDTNTVMPNYASVSTLFTAPGSAPTLSDVLASTDKRTSGYIGERHAGVLGDRLLAAELYASINKQIQDPVDEHWTDDLQAFSGNQIATFRLIPSVSSTSALATSESVVVEDCIPAGFTLETSSRGYSTIRSADANLDCAAGETYVRWDLGEVSASDSMNDLLLPIVYSVRISPLLTPGVYQNVARVTAAGDVAAESPESFRRVTDRQQILLQSLRGVFMEKVALTPQTQVNLPGQTTNELTSWEVRIGNLENDGPADVDVIDRLPIDGADGTDYAGSMTFVGAEVTNPGSADPAGSRSMLYYTTQSSFDTDPHASSNTNPDGSLTGIWSATLPADPALVTGVRYIRTGAFLPGERLAFRIDMVGIGNEPDDTYRNSVEAIERGLGGLMRSAGNSSVVGSEIGDTFWFDENGNGLQDADEPGVPNATVRLTGVDDLGNDVSLITTTNAQGEYSFGPVRSSNADGYTVTFEIPAALQAQGYEFTATEAGADRTIDSNADGDGYAVVVIGADSDNDSIDAGLVLATVDLVKEATPRVGLDVDDVITYTFTTTNTGQVELTDVRLSEAAFTNVDGTELTLDAPPALDTAASTGTPDALAPGQVLVWTAQYTVTADDLGGPIDNEARTSGTSPRGNEVNDTDTEQVTPLGPGSFVYSKTSDPVSGSTVEIGDTITYTLNVVHVGEARVDGASIEDDLSELLDDADYNDDVQTSAGAVEVVDGTLSWTGDLVHGDVVTITYSVTVKTGGDEAIRNVVTTDDPRGACHPDEPCETTHEVEEGTFIFSKASDPESGSTVERGDVVTYTLTVEHRGSGVVNGVSLEDDLSAVLDDASYNGDAHASAGTIDVTGDQLTWTGDLVYGDVVTITYSVTVAPDGDGVLRNTVTTTDSRGSCDPNEPCETTHEVPPTPVEPPTAPPTDPLAKTGVAGFGAAGATAAALLIAGLMTLLHKRRRQEQHGVEVSA